MMPYLRLEATRGGIGIPAAGLALALLLVLMSVAPGFAQDFQTRQLIERMNRMDRDLGDIQRQLSGGARGPAGAPGGSAAPADGGLSPTQAADLSVRFNQLEAELRTLTGSVERVQFDIDQARQRLDKLVADVDFRLSAIERDMAGRATPTGTKSPDAATQTPPAIADSQPRPAKPGALGTLPADATGKPKVDLPQTILPAGGSAKDHYDLAFDFLRRSDYDKAEGAFREFLAIHGDSDLAGNAQYWLAESFYVRQNFEQAARNFLVGYQKYHGNSKAPDSLLKLGMSLSRMNQKKEACAALAQLDTEFPKAPDYVRRQAVVERQQAGCK